ncbi:MAG: TlpA family protein disulfide reductase [Gemmatimonadetes bacterium]|nr:TlpA family protein disulfide reductase [Gemmatimonadota bacterium]
MSEQMQGSSSPADSSEGGRASRVRGWLWAGGIVAGGIATLVVAVSLRQGSAPIAIGERAPDFAARVVIGEGETRSLDDYEGSLVLLNVWATWCMPCQKEMPSIQRLYDAYGDRGLRVVAVSVDDGGQREAIRQFVAEFGLTFDILHDDTGAVFETFQLLGLPETFLIDPEGRIRDRVIGGADWYSEQKRALVEQWLPAEQAS